MRTWVSLRISPLCRHCGAELSVGAVALEIRLVHVTRRRYCCESCARSEWGETRPAEIHKTDQRPDRLDVDFAQLKDLTPVLKRRWTQPDGKSKGGGL
jgi:hypothetical protein